MEMAPCPLLAVQRGVAFSEGNVHEILLVCSLWPNSSAYEIILKSQMTNAPRCRDKMFPVACCDGNTAKEINAYW